MPLFVAAEGNGAPVHRGLALKSLERGVWRRCDNRLIRHETPAEATNSTTFRDKEFLNLQLGGLRELVLARDGYRCRVMRRSGQSQAIHHCASSRSREIPASPEDFALSRQQLEKATNKLLRFRRLQRPAW